MATGVEVAKAGWLYRQSSVLHLWKKNWFVLYRDGLLRYFESPDSPCAEEVYVLRSCCQQIKTGMEVQVEPPSEISGGKSAVMELVMRDGSSLVMCTESIDDMRAWHYILEDARTLVDPNSTGYNPTMPVNYPGYGGYPYSMYRYSNEYPGHVINAPPGQQMIQGADGTTAIINPANNQVVYVDSANLYQRGYRGYNMGYNAYNPMLWPYYY